MGTKEGTQSASRGAWPAPSPAPAPPPPPQPVHAPWPEPNTAPVDTSTTRVAFGPGDEAATATRKRRWIVAAAVIAVAFGLVALLAMQSDGDSEFGERRATTAEVNAAS